MQNTAFKELFQKYIDDRISPSEFNELYAIMQTHYPTAEIDELLEYALQNKTYSISAQEDDLDKLFAAIVQNSSQKHPTAHRIHFLKTTWFRYAAAVIAIVGISSYLWLSREKQPILASTAVNQHLNSDILPERNNAILTLADGSTITLNDAANGTLAQQGSTKIIKLDAGQVSYNLQGKNIKGIEAYNTISTPKGNQYQVVLPDGSKVWLNALSSLKFPVAFTKSTRQVEVTGEAYMEIAKNAKQPFLVKANGTEVRVLGTAFNINAYSDEKLIKTTLVEGSVKVSTASASELLKPGQQAQSITNLTNLRNQIIVQETDVAQVLAWKNGLFNFEGLGVKEVMNQLQRWYNIELVYEGAVPDISFLGKLGKDVELPVILKALRGMGLNFRMEGRKLIIMP